MARGYWDDDGSSRRRSRSRQRPARDHRGTPPAKRGQRWWRRDPEGADPGQGSSFVGIVPGLWVSVRDRGRIIGDRGSNVRKIVDVLRLALGHDEEEHGRAPFVQFNERDGWIEFEIELYPPFNNQASFDKVVPHFCDVVQDMKDAPVEPGSRHCLRPKRIQPDDWECPNIKCGNLCFARRKECPLCKTEKPKVRPSDAPNTTNNLPDGFAHPDFSRPPKHEMKLISTGDRLGKPRPGDCHVVWLVPVARRGYVIGKSGCTVASIKSESGADVVLTQEPEVRHVAMDDYCLAFLCGPPECTRRAVLAVQEAAGGWLAQDGFEPLLGAVEDAFRESGEQRMTIRKLTEVPGVKRALDEIWTLVRGAGLCSLLEVLEQWPANYRVRPSGPEGGSVELARSREGSTTGR